MELLLLLLLITNIYTIYNGINHLRCVHGCNRDNYMIWRFPEIGVPPGPKTSILVGLSILKHPFWGTPIFGDIRISIYIVYNGSKNSSLEVLDTISHSQNPLYNTM